MIQRLLITGAAGRLGTLLREGLKPYAKSIRLSDIDALTEPARDGEEFLRCDLADHEAVSHMVEGVSTIVHMGGAAYEQYFEPILRGNLIGIYNLYDAALAHGVKRIVLASSNHVTGFYGTDEVVSTDMAARPDSLYAASKSFAEMVSSFYFHRHGIETVCVRIGTCISRPKSQRCLATWLSHADFVELIRCALQADNVGHLVVYGVSNNPRKWWRDEAAERLGYHPKDSAADYADQIAPLSQNDAHNLWQGGQVLGRDYRCGGKVPQDWKPDK
ncbi:MAG TPA: NAD(P)-dependent oxidoreductase [Rhodocyclaceae bacterium]|nr:NAD(P)-dependent oxidoreductase [Rhodocyclaceae bacterium]